MYGSTMHTISLDPVKWEGHHRLLTTERAADSGLSHCALHMSSVLRIAQCSKVTSSPPSAVTGFGLVYPVEGLV